MTHSENKLGVLFSEFDYDSAYWRRVKAVHARKTAEKIGAQPDADEDIVAMANAIADMCGIAEQLQDSNLRFKVYANVWAAQSAARRVIAIEGKRMSMFVRRDVEEMRARCRDMLVRENERTSE